MKNLTVHPETHAIEDQAAGPATASQALAGALGLVVLIGAFIRYQYVSHSAFPLNDGGLFFTMTRDLIANAWRIPAHTSYNHLGIPFGYPPLGFYLAGFLSQFLRLDLLQLFRFLPLLFSILSIPAFFFLAREILANDAQALYASFAFAMLPPAFEWLIMGGGITRAPGYFFAILTLGLAVKSMRTGRPLYFASTVACGALTAWFHLEMIWLVVISGLFFGLMLARNWRGLLLGAVFGIGVGLLTAPYWLAVIYQNGLAPFLAALHGNPLNPVYSIFALLTSNWTNEPFLTLLGVLALLGALVLILRKQWLLVGWLLVLLFLNTRSFHRSGVLPVAMLAGVAVQWVVFPAVNRLTAQAAAGTHESHLRGDLSLAANRTALLFLLCWAFISGWLATFIGNPSLQSLSSAQREAMAWVTTHTPAESRFLVLPSSQDWFTDPTAEWFPALTDRTSLTTVQGHEWMPNGDYDQIQHLTEQIIACPQATLACIESLGAQTTGYDYLFVPLRGNEEAVTRFDESVASGLAADPRFTLVYQNPEAIIYRRTGSQ